MCLNSPGKLKVASEDIVVYKVAARLLTFRDSILGKYFYAPYRLTPYVLGETMESELNYIEYEPSEEEAYPIVEAGLHSLGNYADAVELIASQHNSHFKVMYAIIPKGSNYYEGTFNGKLSYASDKIVIHRPMNIWDKLKANFSKRKPVVRN